MAFVLDASVTVTWCYEDESSASTDELLQDLLQGSAIVPVLWEVEVTNVLWQGLRKGRMDLEAAQAFLERLNGFNIVSVAVPMREVLPLAAELRITVYDANYLWLAQHHALPLATLDRRLRSAANQVHVRVLPT